MKTKFTIFLVVLIFAGSFGNVFADFEITTTDINVSLVCSDYSNPGNREVFVDDIPDLGMDWEIELVQGDGNLNLSDLDYYSQYSDGFLYDPVTGYFNLDTEGYFNITFDITKANRINGAYRVVNFRCRFQTQYGWSIWFEEEFRISVNDLLISEII